MHVILVVSALHDDVLRKKLEFSGRLIAGDFQHPRIV